MSACVSNITTKNQNQIILTVCGFDSEYSGLSIGLVWLKNLGRGGTSYNRGRKACVKVVLLFTHNLGFFFILDFLFCIYICLYF